MAHVLLAKILNLPKRKNARQHYTTCTKAQEKLTVFIRRLDELPARKEAAKAAFLANPGDDRLAEWLDLELQCEKAISMIGTIAVHSTDTMTENLRGGAGKLEDACNEALEELAEREKQLTAEDADRSARTGIETRSTSVFKEIAKLRETLQLAFAERETSPRRAWGSLLSVIGNE